MIRKVVATLALALASSMAMAADIQFNGFLTQGWLKSDKNNYFGHSSSSGGSWQFNELGLAATATMTDNLMGAVSVVARNAGGTDNGELRVDYAHLVYDFQLGDWNTQLMVGRNKLDYGFFNSTRDVANTRPSILLPQSIYFDQARKYMINGDGAQVTASRALSDASVITLKYYYAYINGADNPETEAFFLGLNWPGRLESPPAQGVSLQYSTPDSDLKAYYGDGGVEYKPGAADWLRAGKIHMKGLWLSARRTFGDYNMVSELYQLEAKYQNFGSVIPDRVANPRGFYVQVGKTFANNVEAFVRRDIFYLDNGDRNGQKLAAITGRAASDGYAYDTTLGARWHLSKGQSLSAEWHHVNGTGWLPLQDTPTNHQQNWNLFLMQYSINF